MDGIRKRALALALATGLFAAQKAEAGFPLWDYLFTHDPAPAYYSPVRYMAPVAGRVNDHFHGPRISVYAPDRHPEIPPNVTEIPSAKPYQLPDENLIPVLKAPPTSRAR